MEHKYERHHGDPVLVHAPWHPAVGPPLASGCIVAAARHHADGILNRRFDLHPPRRGDHVLAHLRTHRGPAILLCSNYIWTVDDNERLIRRAALVHPDLLVIHGGPSTPSDPAESNTFFTRHGDVAQVLVHGEGEDAIVDILCTLAEADSIEPGVLAGVLGISYRDPSGDLQQTPSRPRRTDLSTLPSPLLTGEFDHIPASSWRLGIHLESNRGCPYGCTFCDWGSATLSRVRHFPFERVVDELRWTALHGIEVVGLADANFGMWKRDAELVDALASIKDDTGLPRSLGFCPAKNTTRHLTRIMETLDRSQIEFECSIGIQSADAATLDALHRTNISTSKLVDLTKQLRARGLPLPADLLIGLPGQTIDSFQADLQFVVDHEILTRVHPCRVLTNAPMNQADYRAEHGIEVDGTSFVQSTNTFSAADRDDMVRMTRMYIVGDTFGLFRHVSRWLQWDHGIPTMSFYRWLMSVADEAPSAYPELHRAIWSFVDNPVPPTSWSPLLDEVADLILSRRDIERDDAFNTVWAVQAHVLPTAGRSYPSTIALPHDFVAYSRSAGWGLLGLGTGDGPSCRLSELGPGKLTIEGDPQQIGTRLTASGGGQELVRKQRYLRVVRDDELHMLTRTCYELWSPLASPGGYFLLTQRVSELRAELRAYQREQQGSSDLPDRPRRTTIPVRAV